MEKIILGKKVSIRPLTQNDANLLFTWWNDGKIMKHVGYKEGLNISLEQIQAKINEEIIDKNEKRTSRRFIIETLDTKVPIGEMSYGDLDLRNNSCTFGIKICDLRFQGQGYGKDALIAFITYLFKNFNLHRVELDTLVENVRAQALYQSVGFKYIGMRRDCWLDPLNNYRSAILMDVIRDEWFNLHKI
jgi:RimJ/RimL family protein N-acetyltransferase